MAVFYLLNSVFIVVRGDGYIAAIDDLQSRLEGIYLHGDIVASIKGQPTRAGANSCGAETGARSI